MNDKFVYEIDGQKGQTLKLYEDRCVVCTKGSLKSLFSKNRPASEKVYFFQHVTDIRINNKTSAGSITFEYQDPQNDPLYGTGNCFEFGAGFTTPMYGVVTSQMDHVYEDIVKYWKETPKAVSTANETSVSIADELLKFKQLLDLGAITQEEYDQQKDRLLK